MKTTFTFAANVGLYGLFTAPQLGYRPPSYLQAVTYNLSLKPGASSSSKDTFSPITTQASSMLPVYLTIEAIPVNPPGFAITDVGVLQHLTSGLTTPVPPITVARFYIENDNIPQSFSYPSPTFTEMLTSLTYTDSRDIKVNITGYGWYRSDTPLLSDITNPSLQMYFANQTKYNFEVNIYDVNCPGCGVTAMQNVLNIFDDEDDYALTNFQVSAGMFYTFNTNTTLIDATDLGIVVSGLDLISRYTFTFGLHSVPFFGNQIFDVTGNFVCKLSYSLSANIVAVSMY